MSKLDNLIKKHYGENNFSFKKLLEVVEETMLNLQPLFEEASVSTTYDAAQKEVPESLRGGVKLPTFKITELWGKVDNKDRTIIEEFTKNLKGDSVEGKIANLNEVIQYDPGADIPKIISAMVVLETLRSILVEYTESVGGFLFEGFLAGIFGGQSIQIVDVTGDEASGQSGKPITDVVLNGVHYSLKLLSPGTSIDGSYKNLVEHFATVEPPEITYLVVRKVGNDVLDFYEFTITQQNFTDYIGWAEYHEVKEESEVSGLSREELADFFRETGVSKRVTEPGIIKIYDSGGKNIARSARAFKEAGAPFSVTYRTDEDVKKIKRYSASVNHLYGGAEMYEKVKLAQTGNFSEFIALLRETPGYQNSAQFHISPTYAASVSQNVGQLDLSEENLLGITEKYLDKLASDLIPIYSALHSFSENINRYFLGVDKKDVTRKRRALAAREDAYLLRDKVDNVVDKEE